MFKLRLPGKKTADDNYRDTNSEKPLGLPPDPELVKRMAENGYEPVFIGPPRSREYAFAEVQRWRKVMKQSALKLN